MRDRDLSVAGACPGNGDDFADELGEFNWRTPESLAEFELNGHAIWGSIRPYTKRQKSKHEEEKEGCSVQYAVVDGFLLCGSCLAVIGGLMSSRDTSHGRNQTQTTSHTLLINFCHRVKMSGWGGYRIIGEDVVLTHLWVGMGHGKWPLGTSPTGRTGLQYLKGNWLSF
jgi:hypothetical protein